MKRRDFLAKSAAGIILPLAGRALAAPCPPPSFSIQGGTSATTLCGSSASDAEADWLLRSTGPGVVWFHDFRSAAEVNAFRWSLGRGSGNDPSNLQRPNTCIWQQGDGIASPGCLELFHAAGSAHSEGTHWYRPYAPLTAPGNGKTANDPAANGTVPVRSYSPTSGGGEIGAMDFGWYGHSSYANADTTHFDGTEYWLQYRTKRDPARVSGGNQANQVGKHLYIASTFQGGLSAQEYVIWSNGGGPNNQRSLAGTNGLRVYKNQFNPLDGQGTPQDNTNHQPGGVTPMWLFNNGSWDTLMYHHRPGRLNVQEELFEIYAAHAGETAFTLIWSQTIATDGFDQRNGYNAAIFSNYNNGFNFPQAYYERWDQIIFSKEFIPCPQV
jgi:hypothetical protein